MGEQMVEFVGNNFLQMDLVYFSQSWDFVIFSLQENPGGFSSFAHHPELDLVSHDQAVWFEPERQLTQTRTDAILQLGINPNCFGYRHYDYLIYLA